MTWKIFLRIVEIRTKIVSLSTFLLASMSAYWQWGTIPWKELCLLFPAILLVDMATTALNTFFDYERGVDNIETNQETDKVLVHENIPSGYALLTAMGLFLIASLLGFFLFLEKGWLLLVLGGLSFLVAFLYSGGPKPISSTPLGELFAGGFLGSVLWLIVQWVWIPSSISFPWLTSLLTSLPSFFFIAAILAVNNACDREGDAKAGRKTLAIAMGKSANLPVLLLPLMAYASWMLLSLFHDFPLRGISFCIIGFIAEFIMLHKAFRKGFSHETKGYQMKIVSRSFLVFTALISLNFLTVFIWPGCF